MICFGFVHDLFRICSWFVLDLFIIHQAPQLPKDKNKEEEDEDAKDKYVVWCIGVWVTWPERPKGAKDEVKMPEGQNASPKGHQLEVGAQWAPRLLVDLYFKRLE